MEPYYLHLLIFAGLVFLLYAAGVPFMRLRRALLLHKISKHCNKYPTKEDQPKMNTPYF